MKTVKLQEVCDFINGDRGKNYPKASEFKQTGVPFINAGHIEDNLINFSEMNYISEEVYDKLGSGKVDFGDIVFCLRGSLGKSAIVNFKKGAIASSLVIIRNKNENILSTSYLMYILSSEIISKQIDKNNTGSSQPNLSASNVKGFLIPLPSLDRQRELIELFDKASDLIKKRQSQIKALDELTKSLFLEMFGDPINNPKKWEVKRLKDVTEKILSGSTPKGGSKVYIENGITFLRSQNVWKNRLDLDDVVYIDKETHNKMIKSSLKYGDILMTKTGRVNTENSSLGRAAIFRGKDDSANINGHVYLIRLQKAIINEFILFILTTDEYKEYIRSVCVGGIDKRQINKEHLEEFPLISPPVELQVQFSKLLRHVEKLKSEMSISLKELEDTFNSLLQRAFKGELFQD